VRLCEFRDELRRLIYFASSICQWVFRADTTVFHEERPPWLVPDPELPQGREAEKSVFGLEILPAYQNSISCSL
jgi:hypothetical protein